MEDEEYTRKYLARLVIEHPDVDEVYSVSTGGEAVQEARARQPEVALLDIKIGPKYNGIQIAELILKELPTIKFVFITGYAHYALDSFTVHPFDYLLKPINRQKLSETLTKLAKLINSSPDYDVGKTVAIRSRNSVNLVLINDILFCEKISRKTVVHTRNAQYDTNRSLQYYETILPSDLFIRTHKSFLINISKVAQVLEIGDRTYSISFRGSDKKAYASKHYFAGIKPLLLELNTLKPI